MLGMAILKLTKTINGQTVRLVLNTSVGGYIATTPEGTTDVVFAERVSARVVHTWTGLGFRAATALRCDLNTPRFAS